MERESVRQERERERDFELTREETTDKGSKWEGKKKKKKGITGNHVKKRRRGKKKRKAGGGGSSGERKSR